MRILVIEDSIRLADTISDALKKENYLVDSVYDGLSGYDNAASDIYDIVILDLMLPKMNGYDVLSKLRKTGHNVPVIILSAKTELEDKLLGFMNGADDYVTKPFEIQELLMRIQAICRRNLNQNPSLLQEGNLLLDLDSCELKNSDTEKSMKISGKELQLLEFFLINHNQVLEKEQITTKIWGYDSDAEYNNVEVYMSFLRKKLRLIKSNVKIKSVRGIGYKMEAEYDK